MTQRSILDPDCCNWRIILNGWPLLWGLTVVQANDAVGEAIICVRENGLGPVMDLKGQPSYEGGDWFDARKICIEEYVGKVEFVPITEEPEADQLAAAYWQGRIDASSHRTHWGRAHYPQQYDKQDAYDIGYRKGPIK